MDSRLYLGNSVIHFLATVKSWQEGWGLGICASLAYMSLMVTGQFDLLYLGKDRKI